MGKTIEFGLENEWRLGLANLVIGLVLWALSTAPVANWLMQGLESEFSFPPNPSGDVIILLGGGVLSGVPDIDGKAAPTCSSLGRIVALFVLCFCRVSAGKIPPVTVHDVYADCVCRTSPAAAVSGASAGTQ